MNKKRPTLKDVAEYSGLALRTVKKVMSGDPSVRDHNREAILRAAEKLNYTPNKAASALGKQILIRLAIVYSNPTNLYFSDANKGFQQCEEELYDYGLCLEYYTTKDGHWKAQEKILNYLLDNQNIDGVVFHPNSATKLDSAINALVEAGKPVVTFGSDAPNSKRLFYVGCDAYKAGRIAGQLLASLMNEQGTAYIVSDYIDQEQASERIRGFKDRIYEFHPYMKIYSHSLTADSKSHHQTINYLLDQKKIDGLFCTDANNTIVAANTLHKENLFSFPFVGFDLTLGSIKELKAGIIDVVLDQKPERYAYNASKQLFNYLVDNNTKVATQLLPIFVVTSECL